MEIDRCPTCAAAVRPGANWCTLCYADLRPPAPVPPPQAVPQPAAVPMAHAVSFAPQPAASSIAADPLTAAYGELLALAGTPETAQPAAATTPTAPTATAPTTTAPAAQDSVGWPCATCGERNAFAVTACTGCGMAFGTGLAGPRRSYDRRAVLLRGIAAAGAVILLVGVLSFLGTKVTTAPTPGDTETTTQTIEPKPDGG